LSLFAALIRKTATLKCDWKNLSQCVKYRCSAQVPASVALVQYVLAKMPARPPRRVRLAKVSAGRHIRAISRPMSGPFDQNARFDGFGSVRFGKNAVRRSLSAASSFFSPWVHSAKISARFLTLGSFGQNAWLRRLWFSSFWQKCRSAIFICGLPIFFRLGFVRPKYLLGS
jgi:hypothetical protein